MRSCHAGLSIFVSHVRACHRVRTEQMLASFAGAIQDIGRNRDWDNNENYVKVRYRASLSKNRVTAHSCDLRIGVDSGRSSFPKAVIRRMRS